VISTRLPGKLSSLLSSVELGKVYHVALGFEDSFLITWRDKAGQDHIDSQSLPLELQEFLYARNNQRRLVRNIANIRCSLGPYNSSFFAHDGSAYRWMNLPTTLVSALQARIKDGNWIDRPRLVALGANDNFCMPIASAALLPRHEMARLYTKTSRPTLLPAYKLCMPQYYRTHKRPIENCWFAGRAIKRREYSDDRVTSSNEHSFDENGANIVSNSRRKQKA
jgi:hypothetical protein